MTKRRTFIKTSAGAMLIFGAGISRGTNHVIVGQDEGFDPNFPRCNLVGNPSSCATSGASGTCDGTCHTADGHTWLATLLCINLVPVYCDTHTQIS